MPDYGDEYDNYRSTTGNITNVAGNPIMWRSRRQDRLAVSVNEAEYYAAAEAAKDCVYINRMVRSLSPDQRLASHPVLKMDSLTAKTCAENPSDNEKQRHIDLRAHYLRDCVTRGDFAIEHIPGSENPADQLTKSLPEATMSKFREFHHLEPREGKVRGPRTGRS